METAFHPLGGFDFGAEFEADHESFAAHIHQEIALGLQFAEARHQEFALFDGVRGQIFVFDGFDVGQRGGATNRAAAPGAAVCGGWPLHHRRLRHETAHRHAAGNPLGHADDVGLDVPVLDGEVLAGAPEAGLHFIDNEDNPMMITDLANRLEEAVRRHNVAAFALNRLDDHRCHLFRRRGGGEDLVELAQRHLATPGGFVHTGGAVAAVGEV